MIKEKSCGAIVIDSGYVLIVKHRGGHYGFPKGHMEAWETEEETAIREVKEETNVDIKVDNKYRYSTSYSPSEGVIKEVVYFLGVKASDDFKPQLSEISKVLWVPIEKAYKKLTYNDSKKLLTDLIEETKNRNV